MREEYDFSDADRGKFPCPNAEMNLPVYLDEDVMEFIREIAEKQDKDISGVVNELLRTEMHLAEVVR